MVHVLLRGRHVVWEPDTVTKRHIGNGDVNLNHRIDPHLETLPSVYAAIDTIQ